MATQKIYDQTDNWASLAAQIADWQAAGLKVAFTNGCFDLVHRGHTDYLEGTRALADKLVVALNTDASVRRLKGPKRPVADEDGRLHVISALGCVDAVTLFDEPTPLAIITALKPDVLTKGDDYTIENIVGAQEVLANGGSVQTVPLVPGYSTSALIQKVLEAYGQS